MESMKIMLWPVLLAGGLVHCGHAQILITGVLDGTLEGNNPKVIELFAAEDIPDLGLYNVETPNNGVPPAGGEFQLYGSARAGEFLYLVSPASVEAFTSAFGVAYHFSRMVASINGDDNVILYHNGKILDNFGVSEQSPAVGWDYAGGWAIRRPGTGPDAAFQLANWEFGLLTGDLTPEELGREVPLGTYTNLAPLPEPGLTGGVASLALLGWGIRRRRCRSGK